MADQYPTKINELSYEGRLFSLKPLAYTQDQNPICRARMSINKKIADEWYSYWFSIVAFGEQAERLAACQDKDEVVVRGRLAVDPPYKDRDAQMQVVVQELERMGGEPVGAAASAAPAHVRDDNDQIPF